MEQYRGKTLLFLDGSALAVPAIRRCRELGIRTIVANYYDDTISVGKKEADEKWDIDYTDLEEMSRRIRERHVDGIFQGWTDSHLPVYAALCEKNGLFCYGNAEQFAVTIDKKRFKVFCRECSVPVPGEYRPVVSENGDLLISEMGKIDYPVIVKPIDSSGSRGIYICKNENELRERFPLAMDASPGRTVVVEDYIRGQHVNFYYTLSDGEIYLSAMADRYVDYLGYESAPVPVLLVHPSRYLEDYERLTGLKVRNMFRKLGMKNGIAFVQGFRCEDGSFKIYEMGYRPNGGGTYSLIKACSGYDQIDMLIHFALTGKMGQSEKLRRQNPHFDKLALMYVVSAGPENIDSFEGLEATRRMKNVVDVIQVRFPGEAHRGFGSHSRIAAYILFTAESPEEISVMLEEMYSYISIKDNQGKEIPYIKVDPAVLGDIRRDDAFLETDKSENGEKKDG